MTSRLTLPARKLFVEHLSAASLKGINNDIKQWTSFDHDSFSIVWIQGKVKQVNRQRDSFQLDDGTGVAMVTKASSVHPGCPQPVLGAYIVVIGELSDVGAMPEVRAMKFHDLTTQRELYEELWVLEVNDLHTHLVASS